ncbi:P1 family peptidase [Stigmatella erecta]|uniref:L-aminopeptidase DmpA. Serine peptidase. MEROPS family S58 n=1 Tax=Stigmatella erecta TaxID=83460 RepID=A0A1H9ZB97_9BACT|nr:P1 family peptidase [Stigmatella erecta]SES78892.1 L-aminopeptidase DmpA. Serine peptidase. MEROPS family S58 [Stigmatella erecta]
MSAPLEPNGPRVRARELGLPLGRFKPGRYNAITDVEGVLVGHCTLVHGEGPLRPGHGPVRTGVTAILPNNGNIFMERMSGGGFVLNGAGEVSGMTQLMEWGLVETPILLTNTMAVGAVSDGVARYLVERYPGIGDELDVIIPIVGECDDSYLNDISGRHVRNQHVLQAIQNAKTGPVPEGNVGGGTGMVTCDFKGGIGTASRKLPEALGGYTLGVLVMSNFGKMHNLRVGGLPVGEVLAEKFKDVPRRGQTYGSIIAVVATDAPLLSHQINRLCKRVGLGIGRVGSYAAHGSGEIVVGFSTANIIPRRTQKMVYKMKILLDQRLDPLYEAVMEATEEAILNAMCMAEPMTGVNGNFCPALPLDEVRRFVDACRPIFASVKKRLAQTSAPASREKPLDVDKEGDVRVAAALPTEVRGAEGIPYPTRPAPEDADDTEGSVSGGSSDT